MSNAFSKFLPIVAGLLITIGLIVFVFMLYSRSQQMANNAATQLSDLTDEYADPYYKYGGTVTGEQVIALLEKVASGSVDLKYVGIDTKLTDAVNYAKTAGNITVNEVSVTTTKVTETSGGKEVLLSAIKDTGNNSYIKPGAMFKGELVKNPGGTTIAVKFTEQ